MKVIGTSDIRYLAILLTLSIIMIFLYGQINHLAEPFINWDLSSYRLMALSSPEINPNIIKPFAFRLLSPYLVGLLPVSDVIGFYILAVTFSICLIFLFYYLLRSIGLPGHVSAITVMLFMFNKYLFGFTVWDYFQLNDLLSLNFILIMFLSIWRKHWLVFGITLVLGVIARETVMLMVPVVFAYLLEKRRLSSELYKVVVAIIPGLVVFCMIRLLIPTSGGNSLITALLIHSHKLYSPEIIFRTLCNSFLPFCFIPLIYFSHTVQFFKTKKYMLFYFALVFVSTMFGSNNERLMAPTFIVFYMLIGSIIWALKPDKKLIALLLLAGILSSFHHIFARWPLPNVNWTYLLTFGSTIVITIFVFLSKAKVPYDPSRKIMLSNDI